MSGAASGSRRNLVGWIRLDSNGNIIPGSVQYRPRGVQPKDGTWRQITSSYCCSCDCIITFMNNAAAGSITNISTADGAIDWTGTLAQNDVVSFVVPNCYDEVFTVQFGEVDLSGINVTYQLAQGEVSVSIDEIYLDPDTTVTHITTGVGTCSQVVVKFSDV